MDLHVLRYARYGRDFPKLAKMSPDAYIQLALQLAHHMCALCSFSSHPVPSFRVHFLHVCPVAVALQILVQYRTRAYPLPVLLT